MLLISGTSNKQVLQWATLIGPPLKHWRAMSEVHSALGSWAWHRYCFSNEEFNTSSFKFSQREKSTFGRFYIQISFTLTSVSYTHLRAHETSLHLVCRLLLEKMGCVAVCLWCVWQSVW